VHVDVVERRDFLQRLEVACANTTPSSPGADVARSRADVARSGADVAYRL
jgi:hypothetical protein